MMGDVMASIPSTLSSSSWSDVKEDPCSSSLPLDMDMDLECHEKQEQEQEGALAEEEEPNEPEPDPVDSIRLTSEKHTKDMLKQFAKFYKKVPCAVLLLALKIPMADCIFSFPQGLFCDVEIRCGSGVFRAGQMGVRPVVPLLCHRLVLGAASQVLHDALVAQEDSDTDRAVIVVPDQMYTRVKEFLDKLYGTIRVRKGASAHFREVLDAFCVSLHHTFERDPFQETELDQCAELGNDYVEEERESDSLNSSAFDEEVPNPAATWPDLRRVASGQEELEVPAAPPPAKRRKTPLKRSRKKKTKGKGGPRPGAGRKKASGRGPALGAEEVGPKIQGLEEMFEKRQGQLSMPVVPFSHGAFEKMLDNSARLRHEVLKKIVSSTTICG